MLPTGKSHLVKVLTSNLLVDLEDHLRAEALKAFEIVRDHTNLNKKRARESEGQLRFRMMEQRFEEVCLTHGGTVLEGGVIPSTDLRVFQPFMRFEVDGKGIIFGLATMSEPQTIPNKNKSRVAGVSLNYHLTPRLDFDSSGPKMGDNFVLLLVSRHRERAGLIEEIAIGIIDSKYENFLFYETVETFLSGHADVPSLPPVNPTAGAVAAVALKAHVKPFVPPEATADEEAIAKDGPPVGA
ncbi:hypothetical protein [Bradyrhizobium sp. SZCCHNRI20481]|uniref:hypothetical protein n=1 Tax=Bradyrhizobium sp. SZCCHNRI20481 TaxID=3057286 RepID=UPI002916EE32|nr:hypothetical protein [Bradyrhizobium sp. SZCCHNRI20481]